MIGFGAPELVIVVALLFTALVLIWPAARICKRAGFSPWLGVLIMIPIGNIVLLWLLACLEWPVLQAERGDQS